MQSIFLICLVFDSPDGKCLSGLSLDLDSAYLGFCLGFESLVFWIFWVFDSPNGKVLYPGVCLGFRWYSLGLLIVRIFWLLRYHLESGYQGFGLIYSFFQFCGS